MHVDSLSMWKIIQTGHIQFRGSEVHHGRSMCSIRECCTYMQTHEHRQKHVHYLLPHMHTHSVCTSACIHPNKLRHQHNKWGCIFCWSIFWATFRLKYIKMAPKMDPETIKLQFLDQLFHKSYQISTNEYIKHAPKMDPKRDTSPNHEGRVLTFGPWALWIFLCGLGCS